MKGTWIVVVLWLAGLLSSVATAGEDGLHLELRSGSAFDGRITASDDTAITFRRSAGGEVRIAWKDLDDASWLVARKAVVDPANGRALLDLALYAADHALRAEAEALAARAVRADAALKPEADALAPRIAVLLHAEAVALFERGQGYLEKEQWYQALGRFQEARRLEPSYALAINGIGEAYLSMRRMKEARQFVAEAIQADPACKDALFNRAYLELLELDFASCLEGMRAVTALPPATGRFGSRGEVFAAGKAAGVDAPEVAWKRFADAALIQAKDLVPIMSEVVKGPGFAKAFTATTQHYELTTDVSQEYADLVAARMELIYAEYDRRYGYDKTGVEKTRGKKLRFPVIVFGDRAGYVAWFTRVLGSPEMAAATGGVYVTLVKHLVFFQGKTFDDTQLVAWHEGFHQYLDYFVGGVPHWFNEGQAEYYGASRLDKAGRKITVGQSNPWRLPTLSKLLSERRLQPAEMLMRLDAGEFMRLGGRTPGQTAAQTWDAGENYAASWALVHFCIEGEGRRFARNLLAYFKALCDGASGAEAFERVWGRTDWVRFNAAFREHCVWLLARANAEREGREPPPAPK